MLATLIIAAISFAVAGMVWLIESRRIKEREQQEQDWQHFLDTGDDRPFAKGIRK